ncbi:MAG: aminoglycoside phosphotransferase family protein [Ktedonobacteraceae bacterium]
MKEYLIELPGAEAFLHEHLGANVQHIQEVGRGEWSVAFAYRLDEHEYVARFGLFGEDFMRDRIVAKYTSERLPLPQIVEIGPYKNGFFALSERAYGNFLDKLDENAMRAVLPNVLETLDAVKEIELTDTSGFGGWDASGIAPHVSWQEALLDVVNDHPEKRTHGWRKSLEEVPEKLVLFNQAAALFATKVALCPNERHLIHDDLLNRNVLVKGNCVTAMLDWGSSSYGDYLYDIAHLLYWWPWFIQWRNIDILWEIEQYYQTKKIDIENFHERLQCYQMHIGLGAMSYHCYTKRWDQFAWNSKRTFDIAHSK